MSGGPEAILQLLEGGVIGENQAAVFAGDRRGANKEPLFAVTDTLRRQDVAFGLTNDATSFTYTATEQKPNQGNVPLDSSAPRQMLPFSGVIHQTVAVFVGAKSITALSYGSYLLRVSPNQPSQPL